MKLQSVEKCDEDLCVYTSLSLSLFHSDCGLFENISLSYHFCVWREDARGFDRLEKLPLEFEYTYIFVSLGVSSERKKERECVCVCLRTRMVLLYVHASGEIPVPSYLSCLKLES